MRSRRLFNWVSSWYALRTSVDKNLPTEYASTTNTSNRYQEHLADPHRDPGPRQFTTDCRSPARHRVAAAITYASLVPAGRILPVARTFKTIRSHSSTSPTTTQHRLKENW